jgi:hypothetical protein
MSLTLSTGQRGYGAGGAAGDTTGIPARHAPAGQAPSLPKSHTQVN